MLGCVNQDRCWVGLACGLGEKFLYQELGKRRAGETARAFPSCCGDFAGRNCLHRVQEMSIFSNVAIVVLRKVSNAVCQQAPSLGRRKHSGSVYPRRPSCPSPRSHELQASQPG